MAQCVKTFYTSQKTLVGSLTLTKKPNTEAHIYNLSAGWTGTEDPGVYQQACLADMMAMDSVRGWVVS